MSPSAFGGARVPLGSPAGCVQPGHSGFALTSADVTVRSSLDFRQSLGRVGP